MIQKIYLDYCLSVTTRTSRCSKYFFGYESIPACLQPDPLLRLYHKVLLKVLLYVKILDGILHTFDGPGED